MKFMARCTCSANTQCALQVFLSCRLQGLPESTTTGGPPKRGLWGLPRDGDAGSEAGCTEYPHGPAGPGCQGPKSQPDVGLVGFPAQDEGIKVKKEEKTLIKICYLIEGQGRLPAEVQKLTSWQARMALQICQWTDWRDFYDKNRFCSMKSMNHEVDRKTKFCWLIIFHLQVQTKIGRKKCPATFRLTFHSEPGHTESV